MNGDNGLVNEFISFIFFCSSDTCNRICHDVSYNRYIKFNKKVVVTE